MIAIALALLACWAILSRAPATPIAQVLRRWRIVTLARQLNRVRRGDVILALLAGMIVATLLAVFDSELVRVMASATPEVIGMVNMLELGTLVGAIAVVAVTRSTVRLRTVAAWARSRRAGRPARTRAPRPAANDKEGDLAQAA